MLTVTHEHMRDVHTEGFAWLILSTVMPNWKHPETHDFEPLSGWTKCDVPDEIKDDIEEEVGEIPMCGYRDPTGTILLTVGTGGDGFPARMRGEGWEATINDLVSGSWD